MLEQVLPMQGFANTNVASTSLEQLVVLQPDPLQHALSLFEADIPEGSTISIEETDGKLIAKYIFRLTYTSKKSGRRMNMIAKGEQLPTERDSLYLCYLRQIVLSPTEVAREFSRIYFLERRSRQDSFLFTAGKTSEGIADQSTNRKVTDTGFEADSLTFEEYS